MSRARAASDNRWGLEAHGKTAGAEALLVQGRPYGFRLKPVLDPTRLDVYGQPARIGTVLEIDGEQAAIVREIFTRFVDGARRLAISQELNADSLPSPGSPDRHRTEGAGDIP